jgi:hypothetical protein
MGVAVHLTVRTSLAVHRWHVALDDDAFDGRSELNKPEDGAYLSVRAVTSG